MDETLALLNDHPPCLLFEQLFLKPLSKDIHIQLVDLKFENLCQLAKRADALWSCQEMTSLVNIVRCKPPGGRITRPQTLAPSQGILCYYDRRFGRAARQCRQPRYRSGKQAGQQPVVAATTGHKSGLLFLCDSITKQQFLVDT